MSKAKGKASKKAKAAAPAPVVDEAPAAAPAGAAPEPASPAAPAFIACRLGPGSSVGRLVVGNVVIERSQTGRLPRGEFERLKAEYGLVEVEE